MIGRPWWMERRWRVLGVLVLSIGAAGCGGSQKEEPELTSAQKTALAEARYRIDSGGLSKRALIQHMTADGWYRENVTFAANNVGADWKEEAVEAARGRMSEVDYSRRSLIDHLVSDGFTRAEAEYAVSKVYD